MAKPEKPKPVVEGAAAAIAAALAPPPASPPASPEEPALAPATEESAAADAPEAAPEPSPAVELSAPTPPAEEVDVALAPLPTAAPKAASRFRVWSHGGLECDNMKFAAGEELPFTEADVVRLSCPAIERIEE